MLFNSLGPPLCVTLSHHPFLHQYPRFTATTISIPNPIYLSPKMDPQYTRNSLKASMVLLLNQLAEISQNLVDCGNQLSEQVILTQVNEIENFCEIDDIEPGKISTLREDSTNSATVLLTEFNSLVAALQNADSRLNTILIDARADFPHDVEIRDGFWVLSDCLEYNWSLCSRVGKVANMSVIQVWRDNC